MTFIEEDSSLRAPRYHRPLNYTFDEGLSDGQGKTGFHWVYNEAGLHCSADAGRLSDICRVAPNEITTIRGAQPSFVYLDAGVWADNADGKGAATSSHRNFGLVCGPNVYLCQFIGGAPTQRSSVPSVDALLHALGKLDCGVKVISHARASNVRAASEHDPSLYLFIPDSHMPPVTWFYNRMAVGVYGGPVSDPPDWFRTTQAWQALPDRYLANLYSLFRAGEQEGSVPRPQGVTGDPDIFGHAGRDLVRFVNALSSLPGHQKSLLHVIHLGDMFELWLGREYQFQPGEFDPFFIAGGVERTAEWALEVMLAGADVFNAFRKLDSAGLREVKYLWGNHDAYTKDPRVTDRVSAPPRDPSYSGLNGDLFSEHGHRFDRSNWDNLSNGWTDRNGPEMANVAFACPVTRTAERLGRLATGAGHPEERDCYLLGATLLYLHQRFVKGARPFQIYVMGHTHSPVLYTYDITVDYHLYAIP
jgi:hypothetical protein